MRPHVAEAPFRKERRFRFRRNVDKLTIVSHMGRGRRVSPPDSVRRTDR